MNACADAAGRRGRPRTWLATLAAILPLAACTAPLTAGDVPSFDPLDMDSAVAVESQAAGPPGMPATDGAYAFQDAMQSPDIIPANPARWNVTIDAIMLWQGFAEGLPLMVDAAGAVALNANDLRTQMGAGPRASLTRALSECHSLEGNYFQARPFNVGFEVPPGAGPYTMTNFGDLAFDDLESATVTGDGFIQSAEINWRKNEWYSPITWIAGFRWVEINSTVAMDYQFANPDPYGSGSVATRAGNSLYGGQLGADVRLWDRGAKWQINAIGKAGVFYNSAFQRSTAGFVTTGGSPFPLGSVSAAGSQTSFFGELGLTTTYRVTDWLAWRAGYSVFWAAGVATPAQQFPLNSFGDVTATIDTTGSLMLHGLTTGLEARW